MFPHNMAKNFRIIFTFFPHPIRSHGYGATLVDVERLEMVKVAHNVKCFLCRSMSDKKTLLTSSNGEELSEVGIK